MGFLDKFIKKVVGSEIGKEIKKFDNEISKTIKDNVGELKGRENQKEVPRDYLHFPQFDGTIGDVSTKSCDKYERCTLDYYKVEESQVREYIDKVIHEGYEKMTNVRYEKGNEYIIIENEDNSLHLVFHVKR